MRIASDLSGRTARTDAVPSAGDGGAQNLALQPKPNQALISGGAETLGAVGRAFDQAIKEQQAFEVSSDVIAGQTRWNQLSQDAMDRIQNLPVDGTQTLEERTEEILTQTTEQFDEWLSGNSDSGFGNVRHDDSRARLQLFRDEAVGRAKVQTKGFLVQKRRAETYARYQNGVNEAIRLAGPGAEDDIGGIMDSLLEHGESPEKVSIQREAALSAVSKNRLNRALSSLSLFGPEHDQETVNNAVTSLQEQILDTSGDFRHLSPDDQLEALKKVKQAEKNVAETKRYEENQKKIIEQERIQKLDTELYKRMALSKDLTTSELDVMLANDELTAEQHSRWTSSILKVQEGQLSGGKVDRGLVLSLDRHLEFQDRLEGEQLEAEKATFREKVEEGFRSGALSETQYNNYRKEWSGKGSAGRLSSEVTDLHVKVARHRANGTAGTKAYFDELEDGFQKGILTSSEYDEYVGKGISARDGRTADALAGSRRELNLFLDEIEVLRGDKKKRKDLYFAVYKGPDDRFEGSQDSLSGTDLTNAGEERFGIDLYDRIKMQEEDYVGMINELKDYVEKNPGVEKEDIEKKMRELLVPAKLEAAKDKYRLQSGRYREERRKDEIRGGLGLSGNLTPFQQGGI